jgi:Flp pilus assembly pilin Flp
VEDRLRRTIFHPSLDPHSIAHALARKFMRRDDGATVVEFGIVVFPFLALLFAIIETALVFFAGQVLETAAADLARLILTGQAQTRNPIATTFKNQFAPDFCLFDCQSNADRCLYLHSFTLPKPTDPISDARHSGFTYHLAPPVTSSSRALSTSGPRSFARSA